MVRHDRTIHLSSDMNISEIIDLVNVAPEEILRFVIEENVQLEEEELLEKLQERARARKKRLVFYVDDETVASTLNSYGFLAKPHTQNYFKTLAEGSLLTKKVSDIVKENSMHRDIAPSRRKMLVRPVPRVMQALQKKEIQRPVSRPEPAEEQEEKIPVMAQFKKRAFKFKGRKAYLYSFLVISCAIVVMLSSFVLASADITITAKRDVISLDIKVKADPDVQQVDTVNFFVPAQFFRIERSATARFMSTGKISTQQKAQGTIIVYNNFSSAPQPLVAGTRFRSSDGKIFRLVSRVTIPGAQVQDGKIVASSIAVSVEADVAGTEYNIGPSDFSIPGFEGTPRFNAFYGKSTAPMTGGASGQVEEVTTNDLSNAAQSLQDAMYKQLEEALKGQLPSGMKVIDGSQVKKIDSIKFSAKVGQRTPDFEGDVKASLEVIVFREQDVDALANQRMAGIVTSDNKIEKKAPFAYNNAVFDSKEQTLTFNAKTDATLMWNINTDRIKREIKGKTENAIAESLKRMTSVNKAKVTFWPFWRDSAPDNEKKINIKVE